jgi:hypothetical protein
MLPITLDKFVEECRNELCFMGLPLNHQPKRDSLATFYYQRYTIREACRFYRSDVKRYEAHVNKAD